MLGSRNLRRNSLAGLLLSISLAACAFAAEPVHVVTVEAYFPGHAASEMDGMIGAPLTRQLLQLPGLSWIESECSEGRCSVVVGVDRKVGEGPALRNVERVNVAASTLPIELPNPPVYFRGDAKALPTLWLALTGETSTPHGARRRRRREGRTESGPGGGGVADSAVPRVVLRPDPPARPDQTRCAGTDAHRRHSGRHRGIQSLRQAGPGPEAVGRCAGLGRRRRQIRKRHANSGQAGGPGRAGRRRRRVCPLRRDAGRVGCRFASAGHARGGAEVEKQLARVREAIPANMRLQSRIDLSAQPRSDDRGSAAAGEQPCKVLANRRSHRQRRPRAAAERAETVVFWDGGNEPLRVLIKGDGVAAAIPALRGGLNQIPGIAARLCEVGGPEAAKPFPVRIRALPAKNRRRFGAGGSGGGPFGGRRRRGRP